MTDGFNLGTAYADVVLRTDGIDASARRAQNAIQGALDRIGGSLQSLGSSMSSLGGSLTLLTAPIAAFGVQGIQAASNFESALKEIEVRAGLTADQMELVRAKALEIGRDTQFSAGQGADAFLQLLTSGQSVEEAFATIDAVIAGAAASGENLGFVSDALTDIMAAFGMEAAQSGDVLEALTDAAGSSSATVSDLVAGFQNVGGVAANFGLSVDETAAILATFSENGIKGAEAGTQLRSMLMNMTRDTEDVTGMWASLGISMFDATGQARPLGDVMQDLRGKLAGMTDEQRINTLKTLGGAFGQLGLTALTSGDSLEDMLGKMEGAGDAGDIAAARMDTFAGAVDFLKGSVETLQINVLGPFMENTLRPLIQTVSNAVNAISEWATANPELANTIVTVMAAVTAAGPILLGLGTAISAIGTAVSALAPIFGILTGPVGLVAAAVGGLVFLFRDQLGPVVEGIVGTFRESFQGVVDAIGPMIEQISGFFGNLFGSLGDGANGDAFGAIFQGIGDAISGSISFVMGGIQRIIEAVTFFFGFLNQGGSIADAFQQAMYHLLPRDLFNSFNQIFTGIMNFINDSVIPGIEMLIEFLVGLWEQVQPGLEALGAWFMDDVLPMVVDFITGTVIPTIAELATWIGERLSEFVAMAAEVWTNVLQPAIENLVGIVINDVLPALMSLGEFVLGILIGALEGLAQIWREVLQPALEIVWNFLVNNIMPIIAQVAGFLIDLLGAALQGVANFWTNTLRPALEAMWQFFTTSILPIIHEVAGAILNIYEQAMQGLVTFWETTLQPALQAIWEFFQNTIIPIFEAVLGVVVDLVEQGLQNVVTFWETVLLPALQGMWDFFQNTIIPIFNEVARIVREVLEAAINNLVGIIENLWTLAQVGIENFKNGIETAFNFIKDNVIQPVIDIISGIGDTINDVLVSLGLVQSEAGNAQAAVSGVMSNPGSATNGAAMMGSRDVGGPGMAGMPYLIGAPQQGREVFIPGDDGHFYNDFAEKLAQVAASNQGGGGMRIDNLTINASGYAEGQAAAQGFREELGELMRFNG